MAFDQFEEFFTLGKSGSDAAGRGNAFLTQLADLIENHMPAVLAERAEQDESITETFDFDRGEVRVLISLRRVFCRIWRVFGPCCRRWPRIDSA